MKYIIIISALIITACSSQPSSSNLAQRQKFTDVVTNSSGAGPVVELKFYGGASLYYPLMAVWLEDEEGKYLQTLFVPRSVATGVFRYGSNVSGKWTEAPRRAPQTLPYWSHKRGVKASDGLYMPDADNPVPDAYSGATPTTSFTLTARADGALPAKFRVLFEINQNWDWNGYWTNDKYPGDVNYLSSAQPALVYETTVDSRDLQDRYIMKAAGHGHPSGQTGELFTDLGTLTTALQIADSIVVRVRNQ
jgi:hypothetical protein